MIEEYIGSTLRQYRKERGLTQEQVAHDADISYRFYQDIEGGKRNPTITTLFKICKAINMAPDSLLLPIWEKWNKEFKESQQTPKS